MYAQDGGICRSVHAPPLSRHVAKGASWSLRTTWCLFNAMLTLPALQSRKTLCSNLLHQVGKPFTECGRYARISLQRIECRR